MKVEKEQRALPWTRKLFEGCGEVVSRYRESGAELLNGSAAQEAIGLKVLNSHHENGT